MNAKMKIHHSLEEWQLHQLSILVRSQLKEYFVIGLVGSLYDAIMVTRQLYHELASAEVLKILFSRRRVDNDVISGLLRSRGVPSDY